MRVSLEISALGLIRRLGSGIRKDPLDGDLRPPGRFESSDRFPMATNCVTEALGDSHDFVRKLLGPNVVVIFGQERREDWDGDIHTWWTVYLV